METLRESNKALGDAIKGALKDYFASRKKAREIKTRARHIKTIQIKKDIAAKFKNAAKKTVCGVAYGAAYAQHKAKSAKNSVVDNFKASKKAVEHINKKGAALFKSAAKKTWGGIKHGAKAVGGFLKEVYYEQPKRDLQAAGKAIKGFAKVTADKAKAFRDKAVKTIAGSALAREIKGAIASGKTFGNGVARTFREASQVYQSTKLSLAAQRAAASSR